MIVYAFFPVSVCAATAVRSMSPVDNTGMPSSSCILGPCVPLPAPGLPMPSVNQIEFHPYWHEDDLLAFHASLGIASNAYSPLDTPDFIQQKWNVSIYTDPTVTEVAKATGATDAEVTLRWALQKGVFQNPRSRRPAHQADNLAVCKPTFPPLSAAQIAAIDAIHPKPWVRPVRKVCPDPITKESNLGATWVQMASFMDKKNLN